MFIDIHAHAYWECPPMFSFLTPEELIAEYDKLGIEKGVLLPVVNCEVYFPQTNEDILNMAEKGIFDIDNADVMADILHYCIKGIEVPYIRGQIGEGLEDNQGWEYVAKIVYGALGRKTLSE